MENSAAIFALVVDDDAFIRMAACDILDEAGFRCQEASDADEAIALLDACAASVVLLFSDVEMPGSKNGFALARHVNWLWPHIEIVIASGRVAPGPKDMPEGATFISKPFNYKAVHDHLSRRE